MATSQTYTSASGITVSLLLSSFVAFLHSSEVKACVTSLVAGGATTCVVITDSTAGSSKGKCWGVNTFGRLGLGDTNSRGDDAGEMGMLLPTIDVGTSKTIVQFAPGFQHTCARLNDNTVKCWGYNNLGQLGQGDTEDRGDASGEMGSQLPIVNLGLGLTAKSISAGTGFTCVILNNNNVKCWGANPFGELGLGDTLNRGNVTGQMGDSLAVVDIGTSIKAVEIRAGGYHVCVRTQTSNKLKCWGGNHFGQLGLGDTNHRGDEVNEMGTNLPFVDLGTVSTIKQVAVGELFTCVLLTDDSIKCFGYNGEGQLGQGVDNQPIGTQSGEMGDDLVATDLGSVTPDTLVCGADHCCSLLTPKGTGIKCWGNNNKGRLGYGDTNNRGDNAGEMGDDLPIVDVGTDIVPLEVAAGGTHTCVRIEGDIDLLCWGNGAGGRLGRGNQLVIGDGAGEMGDDLDYTQVCPTAAPTQEPTDSPTRNPTKRPTTSPTDTGVTLSPTKMPTSKSPTKSPTNKPVLSPTTKPSKNPTKAPVTPSPTKAPIKAPSKSPSASPTKKPSVSPSTAPTVSPTTVSPTDAPVTPAPSKAPVTPEPTIPGATISPSLSPSKSPTKTPTTQTPTKDPTESPTKKPSVSPSKKPSVAPSKSPSSRPTKSPIKGATSSPTIAPLAICNTTNKKKCVKDTRCLWVKVKKQSTCTLFSCSSLSKKKCKKDARCTLSGATCVSAT